MRRTLSAYLITPVLPALLVLQSACAQQEKHGRGYKAPPPTAEVVVIVEKAANGKPLPNASVVFRAVKDDATDGNLEMKTDPDGHAGIDLLEVGSHVTVQVIAEGYATFATDFDLAAGGKQVLIKLERPRAQVSQYGAGGDQPAQVQPGVQERHAGGTPTSVLPAPASPTSPLQTTPPANTPATMPGANTAPANSPAGSPQ